MLRLLFRSFAFLLSLSLFSCGIPLESSPRDLSAELPDALIEGAITTTTPPAVLETVEIFLAQDSGDGVMVLQTVERQIEPDGSVNTILAQVLVGPTSKEQEQGLISPLAEGSILVGTVLDGDILQVQLNSLDGFPIDDSYSNQLAFAMLVCTATELIAGIEVEQVLVLVKRDGLLASVNAPISDGEPSAEGAPVRCENYVSFLPPDLIEGFTNDLPVDPVD
ncbi:MAG TPA: hypothetical protein EYQ49_01550 [Acidimicrobiia bacterium]|jgi:hypothetical protein|nr:hypothetical protein [Acidimicrobiia bacterium]